MSTSVSYGVTGTSVSNPASIKSSYHVIDLTLCVPSGTTPDNSFANAVNSAGMSPILNNANDQGGGGGNYGYYQALKSAGWMAAGGETNGDAEINTVMDAGLVYIDYAGWTGPDSLRSIYSEGITAHGGGLAAWFETYGSNDGNGVSYAACGITTDVMANMAEQAHAAGAKEVGLLMGDWHNDWGAAPYEGLATAIEDAIGSFAGFMIWIGYSYPRSCDTVAAAGAGLLSALQSSWPAQTTATIDTRTGGGGPAPPTPNPGPTTGTVFSGCSEIDIMDYLTKSHNDQSTPGEHSIQIFPQNTTSAVQVNATVRHRSHQPGNE